MKPTFMSIHPLAAGKTESKPCWIAREQARRFIGTGVAVLALLGLVAAGKAQGTAPAGNDLAALAKATREASAAKKPGQQYLWASRWVAVAPKDLDAHLQKAKALEAMGAYVPTIEAGDAALALNPVEGPSLVQLLLARGRALAKSGVPEAAANDFRRAAQIVKRTDPGNSEDLEGLRWGMLLATYGLRVEAVQEERLRRWFETHPDDTSGKTFFAKRPVVREAAVGAPASGEAAALLAQRDALRKRLAEKLDDDESLHIGDLLAGTESPSPAACLQRAELCDRLGLVEEAVFAAALGAEKPGVARTWLEQRWNEADAALTSTNSPAERLAALDRAVRLNPGLVPAHLELANLPDVPRATYHANAAWRVGVLNLTEARALRNVAFRLADWRLLYAITARLEAQGAGDAENIFIQSLAAAAVGDLQLSQENLAIPHDLGAFPSDCAIAQQLIWLLRDPAKPKLHGGIMYFKDGSPEARTVQSMARNLDVTDYGLKDEGKSTPDDLLKGLGAREKAFVESSVYFFAGKLSRDNFLAWANPGYEAGMASFLCGFFRSIKNHDAVSQKDLEAVAASTAVRPLFRAMATARLVSLRPQHWSPPGPRDTILVPLDAPTLPEALVHGVPGQNIEIVAPGIQEAYLDGLTFRVRGRSDEYVFDLKPSQNRGPAEPFFQSFTCLKINGTCRSEDGVIVLDHVAAKLEVSDAAELRDTALASLTNLPGAFSVVIGSTNVAKLSSRAEQLRDRVKQDALERFRKEWVTATNTAGRRIATDRLARSILRYNYSYLGLSQKEAESLFLNQLGDLYWQDPVAGYAFIVNSFDVRIESTMDWLKTANPRLRDDVVGRAKQVASDSRNDYTKYNFEESMRKYEQQVNEVKAFDAGITMHKKLSEELAAKRPKNGGNIFNSADVATPYRSSYNSGYNSGSAGGNRSAPTPTYTPVIPRGTYSDPYRSIDATIRKYSR